MSDISESTSLMTSADCARLAWFYQDQSLEVGLAAVECEDGGCQACSLCLPFAPERKGATAPICARTVEREISRHGHQKARPK